MTINNGLITFDVDSNKENYSQKNNKYVWSYKDAFVKGSTMCNCTAMVMGLDYAGFHFPSGNYEQPEDNLCDCIMRSPEVDAKYKASYPAMYADYKAGKKGAYTPNEIHKLLALGTNIWMNSDVVTFHDNLDFKAALYSNIIYKSLPIVVSGSFPKSDGKRLNHIVTVTGVSYDFAAYQKNGNSAKGLTPVMVKWDDPYGNTLDDWRGSGNDIMVTWGYCMDNLKPLGNSLLKWGHLFEKPVAVV